MKKRRLTRSLFGVAMSTVLIGTQVVPAFADPDIGGTGNVLDYSVSTVVTPTSLKIALNPNSYEVVKKYVKATGVSPAQNTVYYTKEGNTYTKATITGTNDAPWGQNKTADDFYVRVTSDDQVVSLNYGMVNKSTEDRVFSVEITASYTATEGKEAIDFVGTPEEAQEYDEDDNASGAKKNELKMYLALAAAKTAANNNPSITTDEASKTKAFADDFDDDKIYYTKNIQEQTISFATANPQPTAAAALNETDYYEDTLEIGTEIESTQLSDVNMTINTTGQSGFTPIVNGGNDKAASAIAFALDKADFGFKAGESVDLSTTQSQLAEKLILTKINGMAAFTITGYVNPDADWTKADTSSIKFTPVYNGTKEVDGTEEALTGAGYNQIKVAAKTVEVTVKHKGDLVADDSKINMTIGSDATNPDLVTGYTFDKYYTDAICETAFEGKVTANTTTLYAKWNAVEYKVTFMNGETKVDEINVKYNNKIAANAKPADPTKAADENNTYTFAGWYKEAQLTNEFDFDEDVITAATTLYAKFTATAKPKTGVASADNVNDYLLLHGENDAAFNNNVTVTSVIVSNKDVTASAVVGQGYVAIPFTALQAAGVPQGALTIEYVVGGISYVATFE